MDHPELQGLIAAGEGFLISKYFALAALVVVVWDHLLTLSDEVKYVWKREKSWGFWLFIVSRYPILLYKTWLTITSFLPGYTQEVSVSSRLLSTTTGIQTLKLKREPRCNRTVKLEGYYFIFIITLGHVFLTVRVYIVTKANKYVLVVFGVLATSSLATGLWLVSVPSATAIQMPSIPLDPFQACIFTAPKTAEWAYRSQVAFADIFTSVCIVVFALKLKADHGQSHMSRLLRTILQDGVLFFFVMAGFHIAMAFFTFFARPSVQSFPPVAIIVLIPVMISRLMISLRKAVDASSVQTWDGDHFTAIESGEHEMVDFAAPPLAPMSFSPFSLKSPSSHRASS